jgi:hypothetical protein
MNIFNLTVAKFGNAKKNTGGSEINLYRHLVDESMLLKQVEISNYKFLDEKEYRNLKVNLPIIMPCTQFSPSREVKTNLKPNGLMQLDFDFKDNPLIIDWADFRDQLSSKINIIGYAGLSLSGFGVWALLPLKYPERFKEQYNSLEEYFFEYDIILDPACKNYKLPRFYSYDPHAYFHFDAEVYEKYQSDSVPKTIQTPKHVYTKSIDQLESYINEIQNAKIDIAPTYEQYVALSFAFAETYGMAGEDYFLSICEQHSIHNDAKARKQFQYALKRNSGKIKIATFYKYCKDSGISLQNKKTLF